jgi:ABC-type oligopeptide transport system substrate-binding subunit
MTLDRNVFLTTLIMFLLLSSISLVSHPSGLKTVAQSQSSILRVTLTTPPNSLNYLTLTTGGSAWYIIGLEYLQIAGGENAPDGTPSQHHSLTDWYSSNSNFTVWEFNVAPGLRWSDGTSVTVNDILVPWSQKFFFNSSYDYFGYGPEVGKEYALNQSTAVFDLNVSDPLFAQKLGTFYPYGYPAATINEYGPSFDYFGTTIVDGPFYVANYSAGQTTMKLLRNPYYNPPPNITEIDVNLVETESLTTTYIQSGTTDLAPIEWSDVAAVLKNPNVGIIDQKGFDITSLQYNDSIYPYNMSNFRSALVFSINQSDIVNSAFDGYGVSAYSAEGGVLPVDKSWYISNQTMYRFDPAVATSLLAQIGISKGSDGYLQYPNKTDASLTLWTDTDNTADITAAGVVQTDLQNLGFKTNLQTSTEDNIIGNYNSNIQNIRSALLLYTASATTTIPGDSLWLILPGWSYYFGPLVASHYWEWPPSVDAQYWSNESAFYLAENITAQHQYLANVQQINSMNLPSIILAYPDNVWAFDTQRWQGWPSHGAIDFGGGDFNVTSMLDLVPTSGSEGTSTVTSSSSASSSTESSAMNSSSTVQTTPTTVLILSSTTSSQPNNSNLSNIAIGLLVVIAIVAGLAIGLRRRR